ncbi:putative ABC transport system permease protein [Crossiella equi]|uniref:ABC transport system permease protein n=1 Tax=Crossiella equi TaxID=130796 RepID=A0ABS5ACK6_9PSEU|nr:FtsX-like permease family protein [Crossiella equi]MBP2474319.1 putative ABC transport system permease protein [Crossiella equi]
MRKLILAGLRAHWRRLLLAALATLLGTTFVTGTLVLGDSLETNTERTIAGNAAKADVAVIADNQLRKINQDMVGRVSALAGVDQVQGLLQGDVTVLGENGRPQRDQPIGFSVTMRTSATQGRLPERDDEVVLAEQTARAVGRGIGDTVVLLDKGRGQRHAVRVTGLVDGAGQGALALRGGIGLTEPAARLMTGEHAYSELYVRGAAPERLRSRVAEAIGAGPYTVQTGREFAERQVAGSGVDPVVLRSALVMFALVAMFVAMFVIHNTFGILVAQRTRELALARCVGCSSRQVFLGVLAESAVVGVLASVLGLALGTGLGYAALSVMAAIGAGLGPSVFTVTPWAALLSLFAGIAATTAAAALPARAATRVPPIAALRVQQEPKEPKLRRSRVVAAAACCALGVLSATAGVLAGGRIYPLALVAVGGLVFFAGVVLAGPALVRVLGGIIGLPFRRFLGLPGRLAVTNALRHPRRAATTVLALIIGITLTTGVSVITRSLESSVSAGVDTAIPADYVVTPPGTDPDVTLPRSVAEELLTEATALTQVREAPVTVSGETAMLSTMAGSIAPSVLRGSLDSFGAGKVALRPERAQELGIDVGGTLVMRIEGREVRAVVAAVVSGKVVPRTFVSPTWFDQLFPGRGDTSLLIGFAPDRPRAETRALVERATDPVPTARIVATSDAKERLESTLNQVTSLVTGLLALAVLISLIGIANTMTLSVLERSRESALLRALGLARGQLRLVLTTEALLFGLVGGLVGLALGTGFGLAAARVINNDVVLAVPYDRLALVLVGAAAAGVVASLVPVWRVGKVPVVAAMAEN